MTGEFLVVPSEGLEALRHYKYHGVDNSWIANRFGRPFWNWAVGFLPYWMAPNLVTLIGLAFIVASYVALTWHCPLLHGTAPRWAYGLAAVCLFVYQTLDAIDGKQARRTDTSSPLGELFDHGCDAVNGTLFALNLATTMQIGSDHPVMAYLAMLGVILPFYVAVWEEYHTGTLVLGVVNVTEAQIAGMLVFGLTAVFGTDFWLLSLGRVGSFDVRPSALVVLSGLAGGALAIATSCYNVANYLRRGVVPARADQSTSSVPAALHGRTARASPPRGEINAGRERLGAAEVLLQLANLLVLSAAGWIWASYSPNNIHKTSPHLILATVGFLNSHLVGGFIVARVCGRLPIRAFQPVLAPFVVSAVVVLLGHDHDWIARLEWPMIVVCTLHAVGAYLRYGYQVTHDFCRHLGINALTMTPKQRQRALELSKNW